MIVIVAPSVEAALGLGRRDENMRVEAFGAQPSVEPPDEGILDGLCRVE